MITIETYKKTLNILYIEDDKLISGKIKLILEKFFNTVIIASNGVEALELYKTNTIDLIISDINMPKMDGLQFLEELRKMNNEIPFIFVTARDEPDMMLKAIQLDINNYILKPIDLKNFLFIVDKAVEKQFKNYIKNQELNIVKINDTFRWNKETKTLLENNEAVKLTKKELLLLDLFLDCDDKIYSLEEIISNIWDEEYESRDYISCLKNIISRLRSKIPEINIENIYGMGYKIKITK